jgi:hypothetical protein
MSLQSSRISNQGNPSFVNIELISSSFSQYNISFIGEIGRNSEGGVIHFETDSDSSTLLVDGSNFDNIVTSGITGGVISVIGIFASVGMFFCSEFVLRILCILLGIVDTVFENIVGNTESVTVFINTSNYNTVFIQNTVFDKFEKFIFYKKKMLNFI